MSDCVTYCDFVILLVITRYLLKRKSMRMKRNKEERPFYV